MTTRTILLAAACAAACTTQNNSALVIIKVVPPKAATSTTGSGTSCSFDVGDPELSFLPVNLAENQGNVGAVVSNQISPTNADNSLNLDASLFLPHEAVVRFEFPSGTPAGVTIPNNPIRVPVSGLEVARSQTATMAVPMLLPGVIAGPVPDRTFIRATFHINGKLLSGAGASTSEREYLFEVCTAPGCAQNVCL